MGLVGSVFDDEEPYVQSFLAQLTEPHAWQAIED